MATETQGSGMGTGLVLGILVVVLAILAIAYFGGGNFFRGPAGGTNVTVPEQVDVNVNGGTGTQGQ